MTNSKRRLTMALGGALVLFQLTGCFPLVAGGVAGGALVIVDRRNPGTQALDRGIQLEAESMLMKTFGQNVHVNVNVFNRKVLLTGEVRTDQIKNEVGQRVKGMKNVLEVINELVPAPLSGLSSRANDTYLATRIKALYVSNEGVPSSSMTIVVEAGMVYLMGIVTEAEAKKAVDLARQVPGVKQVTMVFDIISEQDKKRLDGQNK